MWARRKLNSQKRRLTTRAGTHFEDVLRSDGDYRKHSEAFYSSGQHPSSCGLHMLWRRSEKVEAC